MIPESLATEKLFTFDRFTLPMVTPTPLPVEQRPNPNPNPNPIPNPGPATVCICQGVTIGIPANLRQNQFCALVHNQTGQVVGVPGSQWGYDQFGQLTLFYGCTAQYCNALYSGYYGPYCGNSVTLPR